MNFTLARLPKSEIEIAASISFSEFEPYVRRASVLISEQTEIEGFRKGKAPYDVVKDRVGEAAIYERAADLAVRKTYPEVLTRLGEKGDLSPSHPVIGRPEIIITKLAPGNPLEYKVRAAVLPVVTLPDYTAIAKRVLQDKKAQTVSDEEIAGALEWLRESRVSLVTVDRPAAKGDRVEVDFEIRSAGVKVADGESRNHPFTLGRGRFIPGFEDALEGMKKDEEKKFSLTVPPDWRDPAFAGKMLDISATMRQVQERIMPEITDEFAKGVGDFASLKVLRINIRGNILAEKKEKENQRGRGLIIAEIAAQSKMELPEVLVASEIEKMAAELKSGIADLGMQWPDYLIHIKKTEEEIKAGWQEEAKNRVRAALVLREIAREENIAPSKEEVAVRADQYLAQFKNAGETAKSIDPAELRDYTQSIIRNEKVFDLLENIG